ncbi:MAG TPA: lipoyl domain-containing protein [Pirellulales bacterium]|jgi:pyruvate/2-oxoglutarate dehydrogenase complex dihydrolipoamide acyltransferase (E2) component
MPPSRHPLILPDLGLPNVTIVVSCWLVESGSAVVEGDRLLEVLAGSVTVDLPAPASGILSALLVAEDDELHVGQVLAIVTADGPEDESA